MPAQICRREEWIQQDGMPLLSTNISLEWLERELSLSAYQLEKRGRVCPLSSDISLSDLFFRNFLEERMYADDSKTIKELKDATFSEPVPTHNKWSKRSLQI